MPLPVNSNPAFLLPRQQFDNHLDMLWFAAHLIQFVKMFNAKIQNQQLEQDAIVMRSRKPFPSKTDENNNQILVNQNVLNQTVAGQNETRPTNGATVAKSAISNGGINQPSPTQQQTVHKQPLCMQTYKHMFRAYRRPGDEKDELTINQDSKHDHIVIACRNQFFALSLTADEAGDAPQSFVDYLYTKLITIWDFCVRLDTVKEDAKFKQQPVALYTTEHRRTWWQIRSNLIKKPQNLQSLTCIEKCLLVLCIDDLAGQSTSSTFIDEADQLARLLHGAQRFSSNRWFDKFLNAMIGPNDFELLFSVASACFQVKTFSANRCPFLRFSVTFSYRHRRRIRSANGAFGVRRPAGYSVRRRVH